MPLTFNHALQACGINPSQVRLLRHQTHGRRGQTPYQLWRSNRPAFDAYRATQAVRNRQRLSASFRASFVVTPDAGTLFVGLYSVDAAKRAVRLASRTTQDAVFKLGDIVAAAAQVGAPCGVTRTLHP